MTKYLVICAIAVSGCCSTQPMTIPVPNCQTPPNITPEVWNDLDLLREALSRDSLIYEECIELYKSRIEAFNEAS